VDCEYSEKGEGIKRRRKAGGRSYSSSPEESIGSTDGDFQGWNTQRNPIRFELNVNHMKLLQRRCSD